MTDITPNSDINIEPSSDMKQNAKIARLLESSAHIFYGQHIANINEDDDDFKNVYMMYQDDLENFLDISKLIKNGDLKQARKFIASLDTAVRMNVPQQVTAYLKKKQKIVIEIYKFNLIFASIAPSTNSCPNGRDLSLSAFVKDSCVMSTL
jgi:hypothetical protein